MYVGDDGAGIAFCSINSTANKLLSCREAIMQEIVLSHAKFDSSTATFISQDLLFACIED